MKKPIEDYNFQQGEILLFDKPREWSSFDIIRVLQKFLRNTKIGFAGTLDPLATGLMILATGKYTKELANLQNLDKTYTGTFFLGATTPSYDRESDVDQTFDISDLSEEKIIAAAESFVNGYSQVPPIFSAIKIKGTRSYKLARRGEATELEPRNIKIYSFKIDKIELPYIHFTVSCSKGTYIRSLAHDLGKKLDAGAYLYDLRRTQIGDYKIEDAWNLDDFIAELKRHLTEQNQKA